MNRIAPRRLLIIAAVMFFMNEGTALADPFTVPPGRDNTMTFLETCIMDSGIPLKFPDSDPCPPPFSCEPGWHGMAGDPAGPFILAGMVSIPSHEPAAADDMGRGTGSTVPMMIMGGTFICLANFIRLCSRRQGQQVSLHSRSGSDMDRGNAIQAQT